MSATILAENKTRRRAAEAEPTLICPLDGLPTTVEETDYSRDAWRVARCTRTGFVFLANPPNYEQLETELAWEKTFAAESARREQEEPVVAKLSAWSKQLKVAARPGRDKMWSLARTAMRTDASRTLHVLDIGCGKGAVLEKFHDRYAALKQPMVPLGVELSKHLAEVSGDKFAALGGRVVQASAVAGVAQFETGSVDLAIMRAFLEHECQPLELLRRLHRVLSDDGSVVLKVPNFDSWNRHARGRRWCGFRYPDHVNYFTPHTLRFVSEAAGFRIARQGWLERLPCSDNMYAVLTKQ